MELLRTGLWIFSIIYAVYSIIQIIADWIILKETKNSFNYQLLTREAEVKIHEAIYTHMGKHARKIIVALCVITALLLT